MGKQRLDTLLAERGLFPSRSRAAASVMAGEVRVGPERRRAAKPGELVDVEEQLSVARAPAVRLARRDQARQRARGAAGWRCAGRSALDVGASTGGFTDCLLQRGRARGDRVDVGYGDARLTACAATRACACSSAPTRAR